MAEKARGPRREPIQRPIEADGAADIGVEARIAAGDKGAILAAARDALGLMQA